MRKLLLMFIMLTTSVMNAQTFDFACTQRLADGLAAAEWTPPLGARKSNFIQTKSFETVYSYENY